MRRTWTVILSAAVLAAAGCSQGGNESTPEAAFQLYKSSMVNKNFPQVWDMMTSASQARMNREAEDLAVQARKAEASAMVDLKNKAQLLDLTVDDLKHMDGKTLCVGLLKMASMTGKDEWSKLSRAQISRVVPQGDRAAVYVSVDGREDARPLPLLKEFGKWKIDTAASEGNTGGPAIQGELPKATP